MYRRFFKRLIDFLLSLLGTILLSPVLAALAVWVKCSSPGPVLFKQKRVGRGKTYFQIYKFRSMRSDTPKDMPTHLLENPEAFITPAGRFLRRTSLDELPQLFNILKGEMSFIGPRPELLRYTMRYTPQEQCILWVRPGISDPSSIRLINLDELVGHDDPEGCYETKILAEKNRMRVAYARSQSFGLDAKVFWETLLCVLKKNLNREPSVRRKMPARQGGNR